MGSRGVIAYAVLMACGAGCTPVLEAPKMPGGGDDMCESLAENNKKRLSPFVVAWPANNKVQLDAASKRGVVVVKFSGCELEVLPECVSPGEYRFTAATPARDKREITTKDELAASLPLGYASFGAQLSADTKLVLDYVAVGEHIAVSHQGPLAGECDGATHYIRAMLIGAYTLDREAAGSAGAHAGVGDAGIKGSHTEAQKHLQGSGDVDACGKLTKPTPLDEAQNSGCGALVQLNLAPVDTPDASKGCTKKCNDELTVCRERRRRLRRDALVSTEDDLEGLAACDRVYRNCNHACGVDLWPTSPDAPPAEEPPGPVDEPSPAPEG